jgi:hypothetical protein
MMLNTQLTPVLKLRLGSDMPSNLTICLLGEERNNFTLFLSIFTNIGNYTSKEKSLIQEEFKFYVKTRTVVKAIVKFLVP